MKPVTRTEPIWEFRELNFSRDVDREDTRQLLTYTAERGRWELDQTRIFRDGRKKIRLRRKVYRVKNTL